MPTPQQIWQTLVEEAGEDAVANATSATVSQAERDLAAAGFDVSAERARASATIEALGGEPASVEKEPEPANETTGWVSRAPPRARPARASSRVLLLAAALAIAGAAGGLLYALAHRPRRPETPVPAPQETPRATPVSPSAAAPQETPHPDSKPRPGRPH